jgi:predicted acyltransferase
MIKSERLISIDFLRGLTVAGMILVNNPGSWEYIYPPFRHAQWNGCTPADFVFPFFIFIVGLSVNFSLSPLKNSGANQSKVLVKIFKRSLILFLLGIFISAFPYFQWEELRIPGVLQRIAIVFLFSALLFLKTSRQFQIAATAVILVSYWIIMSFIPVPGVGAANLEAATNMGAWLDRLLLDGHLWQYSKTWDPEGILSTLPAIASGMLGVLTADWLKKDMEPGVKTTWLFISGIALIIGGLIWDIVFPINKALWTSSFVLYTAGLAMHALAISYWFIDVVKVKRFIQPFIFFGSNAITIYVGSELFSKIFYIVSVGDGTSELSLKGWLYNLFNVGWLGSHNASLLLAITWVILFLIPAWIMYRKKIFIKV